MRTFKFVVFLFYRYYNKDKSLSKIPVGNTAFSLTMLFILHVFQFMVIFNLTKLLPETDKNHRVATLLEGMLLLSPIMLFFWFVVKKINPKELHYDESKIKRGNIYLIAYCTLTMALLVFLIWYKKGRIV